jgi:hypothetical protein
MMVNTSIVKEEMKHFGFLLMSSLLDASFPIAKTFSKG